MNRTIKSAVICWALMAFVIPTANAGGVYLPQKTMTFKSPTPALFDLDKQFTPSFYSDDFTRELDKLRQRLEEMLDKPLKETFSFPILKELTSKSSPEMEMREEGDHYIVKFRLPDPDKWVISVSVANGRLMLSGTSNVPENEYSDNQLFRHGQKVRNFQRSLALPGPVKENAIETKHERDYLTIILAKKPI